MDDPPSIPLSAPIAPVIDPVYQRYADIVQNPNAGSIPPTSAMSPETLAYMDRFNKAVAAGQINPSLPIGPGGRAPTGQALAWQPFDPRQQIFDPHQHFGATYDDPVLGKLQSMWTEPSKSQRQFNRIGPALFGIGLGAITAGAASPFLGPLLNTAIGYGSTGKLDPLSTALSFLPGMAGMVDPSLALATRIGMGGYQATRDPIGGGVSLAQIAARNPFGG